MVGFMVCSKWLCAKALAGCMVLSKALADDEVIERYQLLVHCDALISM